RRHTRFSRDWSSDVCSSDLLARSRRPRPPALPAPVAAALGGPPHVAVAVDLHPAVPAGAARHRLRPAGAVADVDDPAAVDGVHQIGRASWRERVYITVSEGT